ncbi:MAG: hypothetical protein E7001_08175 [Coriobacteriaceae bacterium]|nr:hypothetical protein [Coriobacteriaceae bacterium]
MNPVDIIILALVAIAFVAVCLRVRRKGSCGDCSSAGTCSASHKRSCPAMKGVDQVERELSRGVR